MTQFTVVLCETPGPWDAYVASAVHASNYHRWAWRNAIQETFGHRPYYLSATAGGEIHGVLPLFFVKSSLFGSSLVSMPFFSYGGLLAGSTEATTTLLSRAAELAKELGADHVELRQGAPLDISWPGASPKLTVIVTLPANVDDLWATWSPKVRKRIRYARKHGLQSEWCGPEGVNSFYEVFATNMRNLGTPVYPRKWFENVARYSPEGVNILRILDGNGVVGSALLIPHNDVLELPWAATVPEAREMFSPLAMYGAIFEWAIEKGFKQVDLGRCTPGSGNHQFKKHWHGEEHLLNWYYWPEKAAASRRIHADSPKFRLAVQIWKRLPLAVANRLGPQIVRSIP